jgi:ferric-dicitrate binding protein FerR (iron transport regulator)
MQEERFYYLVSRVLSGSAGEPEKGELQQLIREDERLHMLYLQIFPGNKETAEEEDSEALQAYTAHFARMQIAGQFEEIALEEQPPRRLRGRLLMAASLLIMLSLGGWWFWSAASSVKSEVASREVKTPKGSQSYLTLPDGTEVWLNANSKIVYDDDFNRTDRKVQLTGEAYFNVAKNQEKPFTIQAGGVKVKVLGTVFNLRCYPDEDNIETTLVSGSVAITIDDNPGNTNTIQMKPGEKLSVHNRINTGSLVARRLTDSLDTAEIPILLLSKIRVDPLDSTLLDAAWKEGKLVFDGEDFGKVASKIEKWYNVTVVVENENLYNTSFTGVFGKKSLVKVLNALQATGKLTYRQENDTVYVR